MNKQNEATIDPARQIVEAICRLQAAFQNAGLESPEYIVVKDRLQQRLLEAAFMKFATHRANPDVPPQICGVKIMWAA